MRKLKTLLQIVSILVISFVFFQTARAQSRADSLNAAVAAAVLAYEVLDALGG